ncbi:MAG: carbamoyltransferase HypF [Methanomicrobiales archaeon]|nr:carbamoyltransferase HypF [Methanomicrobiales archaeon]
MRSSGKILVRGIVQGVGFRPFVYAQALQLGIRGTVKNTGSEVEIVAYGDRFEEFLGAVSRGPPLSRIDSVEVHAVNGEAPPAFEILPSGTGALSGFIPPDVAVCRECLEDILQEGGRYENYWATSCVNCGPRYSIIRGIPYDRERTSMAEFPLCPACRREYSDPACRRHHAQTIACAACGPQLALLDAGGGPVETPDPIRETARLLDSGRIVAVRGMGGFHIACIEESAGELKRRLGRTEQPFAIMVKPEALDALAIVSPEERQALTSPERPIVVLRKRDPLAHSSISNLHTLGCMLPYTGLHHLLFTRLEHPLLIMTSANMPGDPMITDTGTAVRRLGKDVDFFLVHNRAILNRCDDSVVRSGYIIRLSRGCAPKRRRIDLGRRQILGVGPELNSNISLYKDGFCITSPHIGHVRNPPTLAYLQETEEKLRRLIGARYDTIAHDLHPAFLSTRFAASLAGEFGADLVAVQHHRAHIAAATMEPCIGIAIDGVGYGDDGRVWGGEIFAGAVPHLERVAHLESVPMPGGDLATRFPERMLYGILPESGTLELLGDRGWSDVELGVLERQVERGVHVAWTSSAGRVLDAAAALLGICRERTYDGEPAMRLEAAAFRGRPEPWPLAYRQSERCEILETRTILAEAFRRFQRTAGLTSAERERTVADIAASVQFNLARGIAALAIHASEQSGIETIVLSGGVAYNDAIRTTIAEELAGRGLTLAVHAEYPLGDGCISYGQCIHAALLHREG